jgi:hypothetical protein
MNQRLPSVCGKRALNVHKWVVEATAHAEDVILESTNSARLTVYSRPLADIECALPGGYDCGLQSPLNVSLHLMPNQ